MYILCPDCGFGREVNPSQIPEDSEMATCPKCGVKFRFRALAEEPDEEFLLEPQAPENRQEPGESPEQAERPEDFSPAGDGGPVKELFPGMRREEATAPGQNEVPWERLDRFGFLQGVLQTVHRVLFFPTLFFATMPLNRGKARPLAFFVLVGAFSTLMVYLWVMFGFSLSNETPGQNPTAMPLMNGAGVGLGWAAILVIVPASSVIQCFLVSGIYHFFLSLFQATSGGYEGTFRAVAYGAAPMVACVIPMLGLWVGMLWSFGVTLVGLKSVHKTDWNRAAMAYVLSTAAIMLMMFMVLQAATMPPPQ